MDNLHWLNPRFFVLVAPSGTVGSLVIIIIIIIIIIFFTFIASSKKITAQQLEKSIIQSRGSLRRNIAEGEAADVGQQV